jgi:hypothetical protein
MNVLCGKSLISLSITSLIPCPEIDHASTDFVVAAVSTNKGAGGSDLEV